MGGDCPNHQHPPSSQACGFVPLTPLLISALRAACCRRCKLSHNFSKKKQIAVNIKTSNPTSADRLSNLVCKRDYEAPFALPNSKTHRNGLCPDQLDFAVRAGYTSAVAWTNLNQLGFFPKKHESQNRELSLKPSAQQ